MVVMDRFIEKELLAWKNEDQPLPLIIRGARQVGKSHTIEKFGKDNFESTVVINFEASPKFNSCFEGNLEPTRIVAALEVLIGQRIIPGQTLLFFDEIHLCPRAIMALRYFKEELPEQHVIAVGSLLDFTIADEKFSFPVGRVQFMQMHPLSFKEFLHAAGKSMLVEHLETVTLDKPLDDFLHNHALEFVHQYLSLGGMPAVLQRFFDSGSYLESQEVQAAIVQAYERDFAKKTHDLSYIFFEKASSLVGKHFKYSKVSKEYLSRDVRKLVEDLSDAGLITRVYHTNTSGLPLLARINERKFKVILLDIGLMQVTLKNLPGNFSEQFVGQELLAMGDPYFDSRIHFWEREKKNSTAEVDYVINLGGKIIPIEVKAGATGRLRSLKQFMQEKEVPLGVRISEAPLSLENDILSVPFYLIDSLSRLC